MTTTNDDRELLKRNADVIIVATSHHGNDRISIEPINSVYGFTTISLFITKSEDGANDNWQTLRERKSDAVRSQRKVPGH